MKRTNRLTVRTLFAALLAVLLCVLTACAPAAEPLSKEEIEALREEYPDSAGQPPMMSMRDYTFSEKVSQRDTFVYVEITGEPQFYSINLSSGGDEKPMKKGETVGSSRAAHFEYPAKVIRDANGTFKGGEKITISTPYLFFDYTPSFKAGDRIVAGIMKDEYKKTRLQFAARCSYYVTEDEHVLSCFKELEGDEKTGLTVDGLFEEVRKAEANATKESE